MIHVSVYYATSLNASSASFTFLSTLVSQRGGGAFGKGGVQGHCIRALCKKTNENLALMLGLSHSRFPMADIMTHLALASLISFI